TTMSRFVVQKLQEETLDVRSGLVNSISYSTPHAGLHELLRDAGRAADLRRQGTPKSEFVDRFRDIDGQFVAIIDEAHVAEMETIVTLYGLPNVTLILVCLDEDDLFTTHGQHVESRLRGAEKVHLRRYRQHELVDIVRARADIGLEPGSITPDAVDAIADQAAGDARLAITLLRRSARQESKQGGQITVETVNSVSPSAHEEIRKSNVRELSTDQRLLYEIINEEEEIRAGDLHERYEARATDPKDRSTRRAYLRSMTTYDLISKQGNGRGTVYIHFTDE
ncbi:Cdc6/Cdc18 family protein, partial [Halogeometricum borinquense]|uniref:Cdc6/Cdc18 family protein n=1 Tax=Halogeometricum borinquense TaxID=60847 RepID=UPI001A9324AB